MDRRADGFSAVGKMIQTYSTGVPSRYFTRFVAMFHPPKNGQVHGSHKIFYPKDESTEIIYLDSTTCSWNFVDAKTSGNRHSRYSFLGRVG